MAADPYAGHADHSLAKAINTNPDNVAPADRHDYDPTDPQWADQPGAAARASGHPRADGDGGRFRSGRARN